MTLDYNDSRIKTKTRVGDRDEINSDNITNNCNYNDYNSKISDNNKRNDSYKLEFIDVNEAINNKGRGIM
nr:MAG TPA: hypothetical protein [Crassvirales sp.]